VPHFDHIRVQAP
jgi:hypothetical protein